MKSGCFTIHMRNLSGKIVLLTISLEYSISISATIASYDINCTHRRMLTMTFTFDYKTIRLKLRIWNDTLYQTWLWKLNFIVILYAHDKLTPETKTIRPETLLICKTVWVNGKPRKWLHSSLTKLCDKLYTVILSLCHLL